jgi:AAA family ATP:ADP antiporter
MNKNVLTDPKLYTPGEGAKKKSKPKLGLMESCRCILTSRYLLMIAVLVLAYGVSINLIECIWKGQIKLLYPDSNDYNALMGKLSLTTGALTILVMLVGANILQRFTWKFAAAITPVFLLLTSLIFFGVIMYENSMGLEASIMGCSVLFVAVVVGLIQNAFTKGVKYSLFDSTKQMAYIPLDQELKVKGQAAVEIIAGRGGKSGGAAIQSTLLLIAGGGVSLSSMVEILGSIVFIVTILWILSVFGLSTKFEALKAEKAKEA